MHFFDITRDINNVKLTTSNTMNPKENTTPPVVTPVLLFVVASPSTAFLAVLSFTKNVKTVIKKNTKPSSVKKLYMQASKMNISPNIKDIL